MTHYSSSLATLHAGLSARPTPESVLTLLSALNLLDHLPPDPASSANLLVHHSTPSSMPTVYATHPGLTRAYESSRAALAHLHSQLAVSSPYLPALSALLASPLSPTDPQALSAYTTSAFSILGVSTPSSPLCRPRHRFATSTPDYPASYPTRPKGARGSTGAHPDLRQILDAASRRALLPGVSVRAYRHAISTIAHLATRTEIMRRSLLSSSLVSFAKSRFAPSISYDDFVSDLPTAAFLAYYTSRLGLRTIFTNQSQALPMDDIAQALLDLALASPTSRPDLLSRVLTSKRVLSKVSVSDQLDLLGRYQEMLHTSSTLLEASFDPNRDRTRMVVRRGDDSSSHNAASRAFNQARTGWLNLLISLSLTDILDSFCPGKVPALVASDVAAWHDLTGSTLHQDIAIFAELPLPWSVVLGDASCSISQVRATALAHGVDPDATGWTEPFRQRSLAPSSLTPDLVHGVAIPWPHLAALLRRSGVFSGQLPVHPPT